MIIGGRVRKSECVPLHREASTRHEQRHESVAIAQDAEVFRLLDRAEIRVRAAEDAHRCAVTEAAAEVAIRAADAGAGPAIMPADGGRALHVADSAAHAGAASAREKAA